MVFVLMGRVPLVFGARHCFLPSRLCFRVCVSVVCFDLLTETSLVNHIQSSNSKSELVGFVAILAQDVRQPACASSRSPGSAATMPMPTPTDLLAAAFDGESVMIALPLSWWFGLVLIVICTGYFCIEKIVTSWSQYWRRQRRAWKKQEDVHARTETADAIPVHSRHRVRHRVSEGDRAEHDPDGDHVPPQMVYDAFRDDAAPRGLDERVVVPLIPRVSRGWESL